MRIPALAAAALMLTALTPMTAGDPIQGTSVGLDHDPESLVTATTSDRDVVEALIPQGRVTGGHLTAAQSVRVPVVARVELSRSVLTAKSLQPGGRGDVYFQNREGRRLTFTVPRGAGVRVVLTKGAPVGGSGGQRRTGELKTNIPEPEPRLCIWKPVGDVDGDGRGDARTDPRIPPPTPRIFSQGQQP